MNGFSYEQARRRERRELKSKGCKGSFRKNKLVDCTVGFKVLHGGSINDTEFPLETAAIANAKTFPLGEHKSTSSCRHTIESIEDVV